MFGYFLYLLLFVVLYYSFMFLTESITHNGFEGENISFTLTSGLDLRWTVLACIFVCFLGVNCYKKKNV